MSKAQGGTKHDSKADMTCIEQLADCIFAYMQLAGSMNKIHFAAALLFSLK